MFVRSILKCISLWVAFTLFDVLVRLPYSTSFWYLNEDGALIDGAMRSLDQHGVLHWFFHSYGPKIIRPWQLLSFAVDGHLFYQQPFLSHFFSMGILGAAQVLLFVSLKKQIGLSWALFVGLLIGVGRAGAEPTLWLSDRHDLFLLLFSAAALASTARWSCVRGKAESLLYLLLVSLCLWGAFYANEKAVVLPALLCLSVLYEHHRRKDELLTVLLSARYLSFVFVCSVTLGLYFILRKFVLGVFIGGYTGSVVPEAGVGREFVSDWIVGVLGTPFWQSTSQVLWIFFLLSIQFFLLLAVFSFQKRASFSGWIVSLFFGVAAIFVASLPTAQFILPFEHLGVFSTRMHWYVFLVWSIVLGYFFSHLSSQMSGKSHLKAFLTVFALIYFSLTAYGGRVAAKQVAAASQLSKDAYAQFTQYCACASPQSPQTVGLPTHYRTVNVFTGPEWLEHVAYYHELPLCEADHERCSVRYHVRPQAKVSVTPYKISQSLLDKIVLPEQESTQRQDCYALSKGFPRTLQAKKNLRLRGRVVKQCEVGQAERIYLLVDGEPYLFTSPHLPSRGKSDREIKEFRSFLFDVPAENVPFGIHEYELVAVSENKRVSVAKGAIERLRSLEERSR